MYEKRPICLHCLLSSKTNLLGLVNLPWNNAGLCSLGEEEDGAGLVAHDHRHALAHRVKLEGVEALVDGLQPRTLYQWISEFVIMCTSAVWQHRDLY